MFPRSGGEKVYLEAAYQRPRFLATVIFSTQALLLSFSGALIRCVVRESNIISFPYCLQLSSVNRTALGGPLT